MRSRHVRGSILFGASCAAERDMMKYAGSTARTAVESWPSSGLSAPRGTSVAGFMRVEEQACAVLVVPSYHLPSKIFGAPQEP